MKKVLLFVAAAALVSGTMVSCGKSTKGKMDGEWKIDSMTMSNTSTSGGSTDTETITIDGTTITFASTNGGVANPTQSGVVNAATWTIKKDGTFERTYSFTITNGSFSQTETMTSTGNWDFAAGVGEFKKNERVVFSTLTETNSSASTGNPTTTNTSTYADGESTEVYVITESKGKSLKMESKGASTYTNGTFTSSDTNETTVSMSL